MGPICVVRNEWFMLVAGFHFGRFTLDFVF
jgi:hypothetical protein